MRHPMRFAAAAALITVLTLAGCASSTTAGVGTTARSGASAASPSPTSGTGFPSGESSASNAPSASSTTLEPLTGQHTGLTFDASFLSALTTLKITPALVGRASLDSASGTLNLPITDGRLVVAGSAVSGQVMHEGSGLSLVAGGVTISLTDLVIDEDQHVVTSTVLANGQIAVRSAAVLDLDVNARKATTSSGGITITGQTGRISADGAALLNKSFRTTAIKAGTLVGSFTVTATG